MHAAVPPDSPPSPRGWLDGDGLRTLLLSNLAILCSLGLSWLRQLHRVHRLARDTASDCDYHAVTLVLGMRLEAGAVGAAYAERLRRAQRLFELQRTRDILLLGGCTDGGAVSEAAQGAAWLVARGLPRERLHLEQASRHTLENLQRARVELSRLPGQPASCILVTSRAHLARSQALAQGLGLSPRLCAAEDRLRPGPGLWLQLAREAYFLHWYRVALGWGRFTRDARGLSKIT